MDPVGPSFVYVPATNQLSQEDADQVIVWHTNMGKGLVDELGVAHRQGTFDVFINGGSRQPGCNTFTKGLSHDELFSSDNRRNTGKSRVTYPRDVTSFYAKNIQTEPQEQVFDVTENLATKTSILSLTGFKNAFHNFQSVSNIFQMYFC